MQSSETVAPRGLVNRESEVWENQQRCARTRPAPEIPLLLISSCRNDQATLRAILTQPAFRLRLARNLEQAAPLIASGKYPVVLVECTIGHHCWKDAWKLIQNSSLYPPPRLLVAAPDDERLWAEIINLGAFDLLVKPFHQEEVRWVVTDAWEQWLRDKEIGEEAPALYMTQGGAH